MIKKSKIKIVVAILTMVSLLLSIVGCGTTNNATKNKDSKVSAESNNVKDSKNATYEIVDMGKRKVKVSKEIKKVFCTSPVGSIAIYTLAPDKLIGWNYKLNKNEKKYVDKKYQELPVLGGWFGKKNTANMENIIKAKPDVIISMGNIDATGVDSANKLQKQLNIPVVLADGELTKLSDSYKFIGNLIGKEQEAKELADYCDNTIKDVKAKVAKIPENKRVKVYYAEGSKGLQTDPESSSHTQVLKIAGGVNVAKVPGKKGYGRSEVSLEKVIAWNPDIIITDVASKGGKDGKGICFYDNVYKNSAWQDIKAVKNKNVYGIPQYPFSWFDRPPSVNRIIGVKWLANKLYPSYVNYDINKEVKEFYKKFYHCDIQDKDLDMLLGKNNK